MPVTYKNLYPDVCGFDNLYLAHRKARRGGKRRRAEVAEFEHNLGENLLRLQRELREQTYQPRPYRTFFVVERKVRKIAAAPYRDRVVHHALLNVVQPIFEARFIHDSYACREGKGTHRAIDRAQHFMQRYAYTLKCDVREFFASVDHALLRERLARHIACPPTLWLIDQILRGGAGVMRDQYTPVYFPGDDLFAVTRPRGLPIGNLTSQHWSNVYLHPLDVFVKQTLRCQGFVRYSDDFLLFAPDRRALHGWREAVVDFLQTLRLTLNEEQAQVCPVRDGVDFLGWRIFPDRRKLRRENVRYALRRMQAQQAAYARGEIDPARVSASVQAWLAHAAHGNTRQLRRRILRKFVLRHAPSRKLRAFGKVDEAA